MTPSLFDVIVAVNVTLDGHATLSAELSTATVAVLTPNVDEVLDDVELVVELVDEGANGLGKPAQAVATRATMMIPETTTNLER